MRSLQFRSSLVGVGQLILHPRIQLCLEFSYFPSFLSSIPSLMGLPPLMQKYMRSVRCVAVVVSAAIIYLGKKLCACSCPPSLFTATHFFLPSYFFLFGPSSTISQRPKKVMILFLNGHCVILLSFYLSAAALLPSENVHGDD